MKDCTEKAESCNSYLTYNSKYKTELYTKHSCLNISSCKGWLKERDRIISRRYYGWTKVTTLGYYILTSVTLRRLQFSWLKILLPNLLTWSRSISRIIITSLFWVLRYILLLSMIKITTGSFDLAFYLNFLFTFSF